jgi:hypothetical protein
MIDESNVKVIIEQSGCKLDHFACLEREDVPYELHISCMHESQMFKIVMNLSQEKVTVFHHILVGWSLSLERRNFYTNLVEKIIECLQVQLEKQSAFRLRFLMGELTWELENKKITGGV